MELKKLGKLPSIGKSKKRAIDDFLEKGGRARERGGEIDEFDKLSYRERLNEAMNAKYRGKTEDQAIQEAQDRKIKYKADERRARTNPVAERGVERIGENDDAAKASVWTNTKARVNTFLNQKPLHQVISDLKQKRKNGGFMGWRER